MNMGSSCVMIFSFLQLYCFIRDITDDAKLDSWGYVRQKFGNRVRSLKLSAEEA